MANSYVGSIYQEAVSGLAPVPQEGYISAPNPRYVRYGMEYEVDWTKQGGGFVTWYVDGQKTWTVTPRSFPARPAQNMSTRLVPVEPMSLIINLGMSSGFQHVDFDNLVFPAQFKVDYVRVYQKAGEPPRSAATRPITPPQIISRDTRTVSTTSLL